MAQIRVYTFYVMRIAFVVYVAYVLPLKVYVKICRIAVCRVAFGNRNAVRYSLYLLGRFGFVHIKTYYLSRQTAYHRD
jgi:hypothetical protein